MRLLARLSDVVARVPGWGFAWLGAAWVALACVLVVRAVEEGALGVGIGIGVAAVVALLGLVVPGLIMAGNSQEEEGPGGVALNDSDVDGRQVFARYCSNCHTLKGANAVGTVGPNLDELRPPKALILDAIAKGRARGQGQMPRNLVDGEDAQNVANFIVKVAGR
jgi:mono/diheme cytochrome c family protein